MTQSNDKRRATIIERYGSWEAYQHFSAQKALISAVKKHPNKGFGSSGKAREAALKSVEVRRENNRDLRSSTGEEE